MKIQRTTKGALRSTEEEKEDLVTSISFLAWRRFAFYLKENNDKYPPGNWKKGMSIDRYERGLMRHVLKYFANKYEGATLEPDVDHLQGIIFNAQGITHEEEKAKLRKGNRK